MTPTLYFLRSSEQKIVTDMLYYAARLDEADSSLDEAPQWHVFDHHYGRTHRDLGLYAMAGHEVAGAAWIRRLEPESGAAGVVDAATPVLMIGVKPAFRAQGVGRALLEQLLLEAGALYDKISVAADEGNRDFFSRFGFESLTEEVMVRTLERGEVARPTDGYDPTRWMD
jgi:ribosomal protein S18 acetylase RimI-like enzyme